MQIEGSKDMDIYIGFLREKRKILSKDMCLKELSGVRFIDKYFCQVEKNTAETRSIKW